MRRLLTPVLTAAVLTAGGVTLATPAAAVAPDPAVLGARSVQTIEYNAGDTLVTDPTTQVTYQERLEGALYVPSGTGPFPVVLFMHGRHETCSYSGFEFVGPPQTCPDNVLTENVRSYRGYAYLAKNLASHGYLVASVSANAINTFDWAGDAGSGERAQVLAKTLDLLSQWNTTNGPGAVGNNLVGKVDVSSIGVMGHSRGGEGVDRFAEYAKTRTDGPKYPGLKAVFALAPTDFGAETVQGVHFATLLPLCDGDVYDLQGSQAYDRGRFLNPTTGFTRAQYTLSGANHNWFNTVWTADDYTSFDGGDPACEFGAGSTRLTESEQRDAGLAIMASFFRRWVGNETAFEDLLKGAEPLPASACPGTATTCPNLVRTSWLSAASSRSIVVGPNTANDTTSAGLPVSATGFTAFSKCTPTTSGTGCPTNPTRGLATQYTLKWNGAATFAAPVSTSGTSVTPFTALTFRTGVNYADAANAPFAAQNVNVVLKDATGAVSNLVAAGSYTSSLRTPAGTSDRELVLDGVWIPLSAFTGVDKTKVTSIELRFGTLTASGSVQLAELGFQS
ncbi:MAG TPA: hypothetical protein VGX28_15000 [Frankiaceae bacterium]|nr:hypothetical protein [Frankiaceae bacterium]